MAWNKTAQEMYKRNAGSFESDPTDEEWQLIGPLLPKPPKLGCPRAADLQEVFNAILRILSAGCQWRRIPKCFLLYATVRNYFHAQRDNGVFERMAGALRDVGRELAGRPGSTASR